MKKKRATFVNWDHLNPLKILDRGTPLMKVSFVALFFFLIGSFFSLLHFLVWMGGFVFFIFTLALGYWLYLQLS